MIIPHSGIFVSIPNNCGALHEIDLASVGDLPGGPVLKTSPSNAEGAGSIPSQGTKIPHASQPKKSQHQTETIL